VLGKADPVSNNSQISYPVSEIIWDAPPLGTLPH